MRWSISYDLSIPGREMGASCGTAALDCVFLPLAENTVEGGCATIGAAFFVIPIMNQIDRYRLGTLEVPILL